MAIRHIRQITGRCVSPTAVLFAHYRMSGRRDLERYFNCPVEFAQPADRFVLSRQALDTPNPSADPRLFDILKPYVERAAKALDVNPESYRDTVESKLYRSLKSGEPKVEAIAPLLAVSPRTLERRLAEEGTSFSEILDHLRRSLALRYLEEPRLDQTQVSQLLGYEDVGSFSQFSGAGPERPRAPFAMILGNSRCCAWPPSRRPRPRSARDDGTAAAAQAQKRTDCGVAACADLPRKRALRWEGEREMIEI